MLFPNCKAIIADVLYLYNVVLTIMTFVHSDKTMNKGNANKSNITVLMMCS